MLEQKIIRDIKDTYDELLHDVMPIEHLPTNVIIETLSTSQQDYLLRLIRDKEVLLICISLKINHQIIDIDELNPEDLQINTLKKYMLHSIEFKQTTALLWIRMFFDEDVKQLANDVYIPPKINQKSNTLILATLIILISIFLWWFYAVEFSSLFGTILFLVIFLSLAYIWDTFKETLPKNQKKHLAEHQFYVASYLSEHLTEHAVKKLML